MMRTELTMNQMEQVNGGTFNDNKYKDLEYANAGIRCVSHLIACNEFWWNGNDIGHDNANAVVFFSKNNGGRQPASLEEALCFKEDNTEKPSNHGCDLFRLA